MNMLELINHDEITDDSKHTVAYLKVYIKKSGDGCLGNLGIMFLKLYKKFYLKKCET